MLVLKSMTSHYKALGLEAGATVDQIKAAWRQLSLAQHPDHNPQDPGATDRYRRIREARDCLLDPVTRAAHDAALRRTARSSSTSSSTSSSSLQSIFEQMLLGEWLRQTRPA